MSTLRIMLAGRDYEITCDDGQESHVKQVARLLDHRMRHLTEQLGRASETQLLMFTNLMLMDEWQEKTRRLEALEAQLTAPSGDGEKEKRQVMERAIAVTLENIAERIETIAETLETS